METARDQADALSLGVSAEAAARLREQMRSDELEIKKYEVEEPQLSAKARMLEETYDALNYRDDQFDLSDAGCPSRSVSWRLHPDWLTKLLS